MGRLTEKRQAAGGLDSLMDALGHRFSSQELLVESLTHPSLEKRGKIEGDYDRLEFLGDRVLGLVVAHEMLTRFPQSGAGGMARRYNALVRRETLARVARGLGLGAHIRMARSELGSGGREKPAILADCLEAVIAALYLDGGLEAARDFILRRWAPLFAEVGSADKDSKTALQEWAHRAGTSQPAYRVVSEEGPPHAPVFTVELSIEGLEPTVGVGSSKRIAEQAAAKAMLERVQGD